MTPQFPIIGRNETQGQQYRNQYGEVVVIVATPTIFEVTVDVAPAFCHLLTRRMSVVHIASGMHSAQRMADRLTVLLTKLRDQQ